MSDETKKIAPLEQPDPHARCAASLREALRWAPDIHPAVANIIACALSFVERRRIERRAA